MLKIRLRRMGSRHRPVFRVVVSDSQRTPTASALEEVGYYNPRREPSTIAIDTDRVAYWRDRGAQLSDAVKKLLKESSKAPVAEAVTPPAATTEPEAAIEPEVAAEPEAATEPEVAAEPETAAEPEAAQASDTSEASDKSDKSDDAAPDDAAPEAATTEEKTEPASA